MTELLTLDLYAVRSKDGKWYCSRGYGGGGSKWVDDINDAKLYSRIGQAKSQVTYWAKHYPEYGVPTLVHITCEPELEFIDQEARVAKALKKIHSSTKKKHIDENTKSRAVIWANNGKEYEKQDCQNCQGPTRRDSIAECESCGRVGYVMVPVGFTQDEMWGILNTYG